jgi:hypothetical protein
LLGAFVLSGLSWLITRDEGKTAEEIEQVRAELDSQLKTQQATIDAYQFGTERIEKSRKSSGFTVASSTNLTKDEARQQLNTLMDEARKLQDDYKLQAEIKIQNLRARGDGLALAASGTPLIFSLALVFAAPIFRMSMQRQYGRYKLASQSDSYYLYYVASRGLWLNIGVVLLLNLFLSGAAYGLTGLIEGVGPIGKSVFWLSLYALTLYWFFNVSSATFTTVYGLRSFHSKPRYACLPMASTCWKKPGEERLKRSPFTSCLNHFRRRLQRIPDFFYVFPLGREIANGQSNNHPSSEYGVGEKCSPGGIDDFYHSLVIFIGTLVTEANHRKWHRSNPFKVRVFVD